MGVENEWGSDSDSEGPQTSLGSELEKKIEELDSQRVRDIWLCESAPEAAGTSSAMADLGRPCKSKDHKYE